MSSSRLEAKVLTFTLFEGNLPSGECLGLCHRRQIKSIFETANEDSAELPAGDVESAAPL